MGAHDPAAAHFAQGPMEILLAEAQAGQDLFGPGFELVAAQLIVAGVNVVMVINLMVRGGLFRLGGLDFLLQLHDFRVDGDGQFQNRFIPGGGGFLGQMADGGIFLQRNGAGIGRLGLEDHGEEGGFARAIGADQADAVLAVGLDGDVFKQRLRPVRFGKL